MNWAALILEDLGRDESSMLAQKSLDSTLYSMLTYELSFVSACRIFVDPRLWGYNFKVLKMIHSFLLCSKTGQLQNLCIEWWQAFFAGYIYILGM
jgi:hypothetical protein